MRSRCRWLALVALCVLSGCLAPGEQAFIAVEEGDAGRLEALLDAGLDPDSTDRNGWNLLHRAVCLRDAAIARALLDHEADVNRLLPWGAKDTMNTHYSYARGCAHRPDPVTSGWSPLVLAAGGGNLEAVRLLTARGAEAHGPYGDYTALHAAAGGCLQIDGDDSHERLSTIRYLAGHGGSVDARTDAGWTPLHEAARWGKVRAAALLIDLGADVKARTKAGCTALHLAAAGGHPDVVELLILRGADVNARNNKGKTPLAATTARPWAVCNEEYRPACAQILRSRGANKDQ